MTTTMNRKRNASARRQTLTTRPKPTTAGRNAATTCNTNTLPMPRSESAIRSDIAEVFARHAAQTPEIEQAATDALAEIKERNLPIELVTSIVMDYATVRINRARGAMRTSLRGAAIGDERRIASVTAGQWAWLTHYMVGSKPLGECDAEDLFASAKRKREMSDGLASAAWFEETVAGKIGEHLVREVLSEQAIAKIQKSA